MGLFGDWCGGFFGPNKKTLYPNLQTSLATSRRKNDCYG